MTQPEQLANGVTLHCGDNRDAMRAIADCSIHSIVTDPPYALVSIVKRFGSPKAAPAKGNDAYMRASAGFMGKQWDTGEVAFDPDFWRECLRVLKPGGHVVAFSGTRTYHRMACAIEDAGFEIRDMLSWLYGSGFPKSHDISRGMSKQLAGPSLCEEWNGWGTALKPACEPICFGRKPLIGTVAANVLKHGTGAINVEGCRIGDRGETQITGAKKTSNTYGVIDVPGGKELPPGRWPANIIHDGSEEVVGAFPDTHSTQANVSRGLQHSGRHGGLADIGGNLKEGTDTIRGHADAGGSAARFFYTAKADQDDRLGSKHPTVKPIDLMQWLVRLVTPKGGLVLDPFAGTGTTAEAAFREGVRCILMERETEYQDDIRRRMALILSGPDERARESIKAKTKDRPIDAGPLFGGVA